VGELEGEWAPVSMEEQPRPVILDPERRAQLSKLRGLVSAGHARSPWIVCKHENSTPSDQSIIPLDTENGRFVWADILSALSRRGIESLMIEGGASIIGETLAQKVADVVIVTIAPVFLGKDAVTINAAVTQEWLADARALSIGNDIVIAGRVRT
jgi:2,5-diamino-6-(ribosylamino)-4(3H)-pyrimidinone 5'-phosphate reductase